MNETSPESQIHATSGHFASNTVVQRNQIVGAIAQNQDIADILLLRDAVLKSIVGRHDAFVPSPIVLQIQKRTQRLHSFASFFQRILDPNSASSRMRSLVHNLKIATQLGWKAQSFRQIPNVFDASFSTPDDLLEPIFATIFQDQEAGLLRQWMHALDTHVEASSRRNTTMMDQAMQRNQPPIGKDIVLVGGGPLTSLVASILGAFCHITVITEQRSLGKPWRNRPIYINSSARITDFNGAPLPLLGGSTTRILGRQQLNNLEIDLLLGTDTKSVLCDTGETVNYVAGPRMGDLVATNILLNADDYLINQRVDVSNIQQTTNGRLRLVLISMEDGTRRELDASTVFMLTGPGKERSNVPASSSSLYQISAHQLDTHLQQTRSRLAWHRQALQNLETMEPSTPGIQAQCHWLRERIAHTPVELPRLLTLTAIEKLYDYWEDDLSADPACFPLADLLMQQHAIAYIGSGDTMRTLKELIEGRGPVSAYPKSGELKGKRSTIYNEVASSPQEYDASNRRRYQGIYTPDTTAIPFKAKRYRLSNGMSRVEVTHQDETGKRHRRLYEYVFDCTGVDRCPIETQFPAALPLQNISDLQGITVARGNAEGSLFITGAATGFNASDFPEQIQTVINTLGIPENTISLWVHGVLTERLAYTYLVRRNQRKNAMRKYEKYT